MSSCGKCSQLIGRQVKNKLKCSQCKVFFHGSCLKLGENEIEVLLSKSWDCRECIAKQRLQRSLSDSTPVKTTNVEKSNLDMDTLTILLNNLKSDLISSQKSLEMKLDENTATLKQLNDTISRQQKCIDSLKTEVNVIKTGYKKAIDLIDEQEQYSRRNTLEIYGIPETREENIPRIIGSLGRAMDLELNDEVIDCAHRLKKRGNGPAGIVVRFVRRMDADLLLQRKIGRRLSPKNIGMDGDNPIFINQSLTLKRRQLLKSARLLQKQNLVRHVWSDRVGRIKVRKQDGGKVILIQSEDDLEQFSN